MAARRAWSGDVPACAAASILKNVDFQVDRWMFNFQIVWKFKDVRMYKLFLKICECTGIFFPLNRYPSENIVGEMEIIQAHFFCQ